MVAVDILFLLPPVMAIYGLVPAIMAYWNCLVRGNRFDFISATKVANGGRSASPKIGPQRAASRGSLELPQVVIGRADEDDAEVRLRQSTRGSFSKTPKSDGSPT